MATPSEAEVGFSREITSFNKETIAKYDKVGDLLTDEIKRTNLKGEQAYRQTVSIMHRLAILADELNAHETALGWMGEIMVECGTSASIGGWLVQEQNTQRIQMTRTAEEAMKPPQQQQQQIQR